MAGSILDWVSFPLTKAKVTQVYSRSVRVLNAFHFAVCLLRAVTLYALDQD